ncbi:MAG: YqgE/AlgH family protein [Flavobacteriales bacterium]|jgi:putative transcriptional regulator|nr:YqgE/AlgH family protein [Flavobacteriales bacterium]
MAGILDLDPRNKHRLAGGRLLVSGPYLPDPYFRRTVVLLCEHNDQGSFGFVLNRPMDIVVNDLVEGIPPMTDPVSIGGPVQSDDLFYLHTLGPHLQGSVPVVDGVHMGGDYDQLRAMLRADPRLLRHVRFFVGYSGWGAQQLDRELEERSWWVSRADRRRIMRTGLPDLWGETLRSMGRAYALVANLPEDPTHN